MRTRPILWSSPMVLALLAGRKTQTRRMLKPQPDNPETFGVSPIWGSGPLRSDPDARFHVHAAFNVEGKRVDRWLPCPYGAPGDRLWGRETWRTWERPADGLDGVIYNADNAFRAIEPTAEAADAWVNAHENGKHGLKWRPSIFMPRWASRLLHEVTAVRVERLQDISEADAIAEGIEQRTGGSGAFKGWGWPTSADVFVTPRAAYFAGWDTINGPGASVANPWVWVVSFKAVTR